jgi:predicted translin family RNA/ssDNA-binding protein
MKLEHSGIKSDSSRSVREADRHSKMATKGHRKKSKAENLAKEAEMDRDLYELKVDIEEFELWMQQDRRMR